MVPTTQDKRQDFLWIVQTIMPRQTDIEGFTGHVGDAVAASYRIPADMTARDAALEFVAWLSPSFRGGGERDCPAWISMLQDPTYSRS